MLSLEQGATIVSLARKAIASKFSLLPLRVPAKVKQEFSPPLGCYVKLFRHGQLRGMFGYAETGLPLYESVVSVAKTAAFSDPRFPALTKAEVKEVHIEVDIATKPKQVHVRNPGDYVRHVRVGVDGIVLKATFTTSTLLPETAVQNGWDALTFLRQAALHAQLKPDDWQDFEQCRVYTFQTQMFGETPEGIIQLK